MVKVCADASVRRDDSPALPTPIGYSPPDCLRGHVAPATTSGPAATNGSLSTRPPSPPEQLRAVDPTERSEERLPKLVVVATSQLIWKTDGSGDVVDDIPMWRAFTGQTYDEVKGTGWLAAIHPDDEERVRAAWFEAIERRVPYRQEYRLRRCDGQYRDMDSLAVPITGPDQSVREWIGATTDITDRKHVEADLQALHNLLATIERIGHIGGWTYDVLHDVVTWSEESYRIFGRDPQQWSPSVPKLLAATHPDDRQRLQDAIAASITQGAPFEAEFRIIRPDGAGRYVATRAELCHDETGRVVSLAGTCHDITERKQAEAELAESEQRFRLVVEEAPDAILLYDIDQGRFVGANKAAERLFGCGRDELLTHGPQHFYPDLQPDDRAVAETFSEHIAAAVAGTELHFQRRVRDAAGTERVCDVTLVILPSGGRRLLRASFVDITEKHRAESALAEQAALLATEHELSPDGILVVDAKARIVSVNHRYAEMFGIPAELVGARDAAPVLSRVVEMVDDPENFKTRIRYLYDHPDESGRDEIRLKDGRVIDRHTAPMKQADGSYLGRVWFFRDITDRIAARRDLERTNRALRTLSRGNEVVVHSTSEAELVSGMCRAIVDTGGYYMAWVGMAEPDGAKSIKPVAWAGNAGQYLQKADIGWGEGARGAGPHGRAIRTGEPQVTQDFSLDPSMAPWAEEAKKAGFVSSAVLPLKDGSASFGTLTIDAAEPGAFNSEELRLLQELANHLAFGIRNLRSHAAREALETRWRASLEATIGAIANTVEQRDPYTAGHQQRVARLAVKLARDIGMAEEQIEGLYLAGIVHDVGKIRIPAEIINKPGRLSAIEIKLIHTHAEAGFEIIQGVEFPWPIAEIVRQHHERIDGSGYPRGLKGDAILLEAKILSVADVVEAIMSHRPYRPGLGVEAAVTEITDGRGRLYDPAVVDACTALLQSKDFRFD